MSSCFKADELEHPVSV